MADTVTPMTDGGYVASHIGTAERFGITVTAVYAQKFDGSGAPLGPEAVMTAPPQAGTNAYSLVALQGGGYAALLPEVTRGGPGADVFVADADGNLINELNPNQFNQAYDYNIVAGAQGGFLVSFRELNGQPGLKLYTTQGDPLSDEIQTAGPLQAIQARPDGIIEVVWSDGGVNRTMLLDPRTVSHEGAGAGPAFQVLDSHGSAILDGGPTSDLGVTLRVPVSQTGEVFAAVTLDGPAGWNIGGAGVQVSEADVARGYLEITEHLQGTGSYYVEVRETDSNGAATQISVHRFTEVPPGQTLQGQAGGSHLAGGDGDDTLIAGTGPDVMTGLGGADHFAFEFVPWQGAQISDFTDGVDRIDVSALLAQASYAGSDPVADGYVRAYDAGNGSTWLYFDSDGKSSADQWGSYLGTLQHVAPGQITSADLTSGSGSPPPPPPPSGETLRGQSGGSNLVGGSGADTLIGGTGPDTMTGAGGADHFVWSQLPWAGGQITDFTHGVDKIDLSGVLAGVHYTGADPIADRAPLRRWRRRSLALLRH